MAAPARTSLGLKVAAAVLVPFGLAALWTARGGACAPPAAEQGPAIVAEPEVLDLGSVPVGSVQPVRFRLRNRGASKVAFGLVEAECGCLHMRVGLPVIDPGEETSVTGKIEVQAPGPDRVRLRVPVLERADGGEGSDDIELAVELNGIAAPVVLPRLMQAGRVEDDGLAEVDFVVAALGCSASGERPSIELGGDLEGSFELEPDGVEEGVWNVRGHVRARGDALFGMLQGSLSVRAGSCADDEAARVVLERVPSSSPEPWPPCRLLLGPERPRAELRLPGSPIRRWRWTPAAPAPDEAPIPAVRLGEEGELLLERRAGPSAAARTHGLELWTPLGRVLVHVLVH